MSPTATVDDWVSIAEAAEQLGVHPRTLRRYIRDEKLAVMRLSPQVVRISQAELGRFTDAHVKVTTGTGNCYVPRPAEVVKNRKTAAPAKPSPARFGRFG